MSTTDNTTSPTAEELQVWTEQVRDWFNETGKKYLSKDLKADLAAQDAKWCHTCRTVKAVTGFAKNSGMPDGLNSQCRPCKNGACTEWREANPDLKRECDRAYHAANREKRNEYDREYGRTMYATDELFRLRRQLNSGYHRAVEAGNPAERITAEDLLTYWADRGIDPLRCALTGEALTPQTRGIDHATPISRGGSHQPSNLIPVSFEANMAKGTRTLLEFLADRAAEQNNDDLPELVKRALSTTVPERAKRSVLVQLEEGADHE